jgi:hypothetical protein
MEWIVIIIVIAIFITCFDVRRNVKKTSDKMLKYHFEFSTDEVFEEEYIYLIQEITNDSEKDVAFLKTETLMPEGLRIVLVEDGKLYSGNDTECQSVQSVFQLPAGSTVRRKWRVLAQKRGVYRAEQVQMIAIYNDPLGMTATSHQMQPESGGHNQVIVLPRVKEWITYMALSPTYAGERILPQGLIHDPMSFIGVRDYEPRDPLNTVDWKQTARLGRTVVRETEYQYNDSYNIVLNMQSMLIEPSPPEISTPPYIEDCISVCASLLDSAVRRDIPVALIANVPTVEQYGHPLVEHDETGERIFCSEEYRQQAQVIRAYRMLAALPMQMTITIETLLDDMIARPHLYARGGNIVLVTTFLNDRMIGFHRAMQERGIQVIFFVATTYNNAIQIPGDVPVYFRVTQWIGGVGHAS